MASYIERFKQDKKGKLMLIILAVGLFAIFVFYNLMSGPAAVQSTAVSQVKAPPGGLDGALGTNVTSAYRENLKLADQQRVEAAQSTGSSAMPSLVGGNTDQTVMLGDDKPNIKVDDPIPEPPRITRPAPSAERLTSTAVASGPPKPTYSPEQVEKITAFLERMTPSREYAPATMEYIYTPPEPMSESVDQRTFAAAESRTAPSGPVVELPLPGTIWYSTLRGRATSDAPGPILATIHEGPYAGATALGSFSVGQDALVMTFTTLSIQDLNVSVPINAVAVDTKYIGSAMATDVDRHMTQKIAVAFVSSFMGGLADVIQNAGTVATERLDGSLTTSRPDLSATEKLAVAGGQAASSAGQVIQQEYGSRPTTVTVEAGTPIGLLFID